MPEHDHYLSFSLPGVLCPDTKAEVLAVEHCAIQQFAVYYRRPFGLEHDLDHFASFSYFFTACSISASILCSAGAVR